jgi:hypothetical protein
MEDHLLKIVEGNYRGQRNKATSTDVKVGNTLIIDDNTMLLTRAEMIESGVVVARVRTVNVENERPLR